MPGKHPGQRQQPFQLRVADTASPYRIADIFGEVLVWLLAMQDVCAVRFADHLPSARPVYDPAKKCKDAVVSARQILTFFK